MENKIELKELAKQPVLSMRTSTSVENLQKVIGESYGKIMQYLSELGKQPSDVAFVAYYNMDMQDLDVEIGFPVETVIEGKEDINKCEIPAGRCVAMMYKGPYSEMERPYNMMNN